MGWRVQCLSVPARQCHRDKSQSFRGDGLWHDHRRQASRCLLEKLHLLDFMGGKMAQSELHERVTSTLLLLHHRRVAAVLLWVAGRRRLYWDGY